MSSTKNWISADSFQTFGDILKYLRRRAGLTQRDLSIMVNYSEAQISRLERNLRPPDIAALTALFVPALFVEDEPEMVSRFMELAAYARGEEPPHQGIAVTSQSTQKQIVEDVRVIEENVQNNLPLQLTSFVGREREIAEIKKLLVSGHSKVRLITLTGSGGCGKTRLALETASHLEGNYQDGIWFIELASILKPSHVQQKFISSLGIPEPSKESSSKALTKFLRSKHLLLIVDNCEHVREETAKLIQGILFCCSQVQILATSQETLHIPGELRFNVPSLSVAKGAHSESVRLFVERAKSSLPVFELTEDNAYHVIQICRRLEGIPLAIELAAAKAAVLTVQQIASMLEKSFHLLTGGNAILERHRTMDATVHWSYDMLSEAEKGLLRRLSVFSGGWLLEAAQAIVSDPELIPFESVFDLLSQLVHKSLVIVKWDSRTEARYDMLQTVLEFARKKSGSTGEIENLRERHFQYFCSTALERERDLFSGRHTIDWAEAEIDNLRELFSWALATENATSGEHTGKAMELMSHVHLLWLARGYFSEGKDWLAQLLAVHTTGTLYRARALVLASVFAAYEGDHKQQFALVQESLALSRKHKDRKYIAWSMCWMGLAECDLHNYEKSIQYLSGSLKILEDLKENIWVIYATYFLAEAFLLNGDLKSAKSFWKQGIDLCGNEDFTWPIAWGKEGLGRVERFEGNFEKAKKYYFDSLKIRSAFRDIEGVASSFENLALLAAGQKQFNKAVKLWGAAEKLRQRLSHARTPTIDLTSSLSATRSELGEECFQSMWYEGRRMSTEQAVEFALAD